MTEGQLDTDFTCEGCGETFEKGWTDAENVAEAVSIFGGPIPPDAATVCDNCYTAIMAFAAEQGYPKQWDPP